MDLQNRSFNVRDRTYYHGNMRRNSCRSGGVFVKKIAMLFLDDLVSPENVSDYFVPVSEMQNALIISTSFNIDDCENGTTHQSHVDALKIDFSL